MFLKIKENQDAPKKLTLKNYLYGAMISVPTPFPGSQLYNQLEAENRILTRHWGSYTLWNVVVKPRNMTVEELEAGFAYTLREIYAPRAVRERMAHFKEIYRSLGQVSDCQMEMG